MVTIAPSPSPMAVHPTRAGLAPAFLWSLQQVLSAAVPVGCLLAVQATLVGVVAGRQTGDLAFGALVAVLVATTLSWLLRRQVILRTPGAMSRRVRPAKIAVADIAAMTLQVAALAAATFILAPTGDPRGYVAGAFTFLGGYLAVNTIIRVGKSVFSGARHAGRVWAWEACTLTEAGVMIFGGLALAPSSGASDVATTVLPYSLIFALFIFVLKGVLSSATSTANMTDEVTSVVLDRAVGAPTLRTAQVTRRRVQIALWCTAGGLLVLASPWAFPALVG